MALKKISIHSLTCSVSCVYLFDTWPVAPNLWFYFQIWVFYAFVVFFLEGLELLGFNCVAVI